MGMVIHDAIVVTSWQESGVTAAREKALSLGLVCTDAVPYAINEGWSFMIAPDGSKVGWGVREKHDAARAKWVEWASGQYVLGVYFDFAHVQFGSERQRRADVIADNHNVDAEMARDRRTRTALSHLARRAARRARRGGAR